jgi:DNA-binding winged helix-turn-helix (wHTH) protein
MSTDTLSFPPFTLDPTTARLWRGKKRITLSPKDFALLHYFTTHPGQVVTHAELLQAVWGATVVGSEVLKVRIGRLRRLLGDKTASPRFVESVHGLGYRFIGEVGSSQHSVVSSPPPRNCSISPGKQAVI